MSMKKLYGVTVAMTTPFKNNGEIDVAALEQLTEILLKKGVNCLYPCGTTGEMVHLSVEERMLVAETVIRTAKDKGTVFIHCGAVKQEETETLLKHAVEIGADGAGVVTPIFLGVNQNEIIQYYERLSALVPEDFPIYLYNIPQCAGNDILPESARKLHGECPNLRGIKYSYPDMMRTLEYLDIPEFSVLHGSDKLFSSLLVMGCDGTVSGVAGVFPEPFVEVYKAWLAQDLQKMKEWQKICVRFCDILKCGTNMSYFKEALTFRGVDMGGMRLPQRNISEEEKAELKKRLEEECRKSGITLKVVK